MALLGLGRPHSLPVLTLGVWGTCLVWALFHERISSVPYGDERYRQVTVLNCVQAVICAAAAACALRLRGGPGLRELAGWPPRLLARFAFVALCHTMASPIGYAALQLIDYPLVILATSLKMLPQMLVGVALGRRYDRADVLSVSLMTAGVVLYSASKIAPVWATPPGGSAAATAAAASTLRDTLGGLALLALNLLADAVVTNGQDSLYHGSRVTPFQMMFMLNTFSACFLLGFLGLDRAVRGEGSTLALAAGFVSRHPAIAGHALAFSACGAAAQLVIYVSVRAFGSFATSFITISRKFATILLSVVIYGHALTRAQWAGVALVFAGFVAQVTLKSHGGGGGSQGGGAGASGLKRRQSLAAPAAFAVGGGGGGTGRRGSAASPVQPQPPAALRLGGGSGADAFESSLGLELDGGASPHWRDSGARGAASPPVASAPDRSPRAFALSGGGSVGSTAPISPKMEAPLAPGLRLRRRASTSGGAAPALGAAASGAREAPQSPLATAVTPVPAPQPRVGVAGSGGGRDRLPSESRNGAATALPHLHHAAASAAMGSTPRGGAAVQPQAVRQVQLVQSGRRRLESSTAAAAAGAHSGGAADSLRKRTVLRAASARGWQPLVSPPAPAVSPPRAPLDEDDLTDVDGAQHQLPLAGAGGSLSPMLPLGQLSSDGIASGSPTRAPSPLALDEDVTDSRGGSGGTRLFADDGAT